jgi:hypothetical protein
VKLCYSAAVRNITVSVSDEVYKAARVRAAESGTSVSALVAEYLSSLSSSRSEFKRLERQQKRIASQIKRFKAADRVSRDRLHDRALR